MSATTEATNGRPRKKHLSDELDRLDAILDGLADGLTGAVADACREGSRAAVRDAIRDVLADPALRRLLIPPPPVPFSPKGPGLGTRIGTRAADLWRRAAGRVARCYCGARIWVRGLRDGLTAAQNRAGPFPAGRAALVAVCAGLGAGLIALAVPELAPSLAGAACAGAVGAAQLALWLIGATGANGPYDPDPGSDYRI